jgi:hypothetical protein
MCNIIFLVGICKSAIAIHSAISVDSAELNFTHIERFVLPFKSTGHCIYVLPNHKTKFILKEELIETAQTNLLSATT